MLESVARLFDTSDFSARWNCGRWTPELGWLHILSDLGVWAAYVAIPLVLGYFALRRRDVPFRGVFVLFGAFILACGTTHLMEAVIFWWPAYRLAGVIKLLTAAVSWGTVVALVGVAPRALAMRSPEELEREIAERVRAQEALAEKNRQLVEAERVKTQFLATVSHELRTPLTLILAPVESALAGEYGPVPDAQRAGLRTVHNNAVRLLQMVTGLLDFARVEAGKVEVNREPVDAAAVTRAVVADFGPLAARNGLTLTAEDVPAAAPVRLDRYLYERVLFNLVSNAVKFTPPGGRVTVRLAAAGGRLRLTVADTGIGIPPADLPNLFQVFRQLEGSSTRRFEGSGLGLSLVKEFAGLLGGTVAVESEPGRGSTFTVECDAPAAGEAADGPRPAAGLVPRFDTPLPPAPSPPDGAADDRPKLLVAEDNPELAGYISDLMADACRVRTAADGEAALAAAREWAPDVVLADVMMPGRDGLDLCRALKADPATARAPVVLLTALTHRDALIRGWEAGADEYLFKPFHPRELSTRIATLLAAARERRRADDRERALAREQAARAAAEDGVAARDRFLSVASHELRTPLNPLRINLHVLLRAARDGSLSAAGPLAAKITGLLDTCDRQVRQFAHLVDNLLDVSRIAAGRLDLRLEEVDLAAVARDVVARFGPEAEQAGCQLTLAADGPAVGRWDRSRLDQVVTNLVSNALKYGKGRPVEVTVGGNGAGAVRLTVRDEGIGIAPADQGRIFDRFERAAVGYEYAGLGLGLYIARQIAEALGGTIGVTSEPGRGAVFAVELPAGVEVGAGPAPGGPVSSAA